MKSKLLDSKKYFVYKHTAPNNKVYIGITHLDPEDRWLKGFGYHTQKVFFNAIIKYGWINFKHEILFNGLTEEEALNREEELIQFYKSYDRRYGYNISLRGAKYGEFVNKEINRREKGLNLISKLPKWKQAGREVLKIDKEGNILERFKSVGEASRYLQENVESLRTRLNKYNILDYDTFDITYGKEKEVPKIEMLTLNGDFVKLFNNLAEAHIFLGKKNVGHISDVCRNKRHSYAGFKWRYRYENKNN